MTGIRKLATFVKRLDRTGEGAVFKLDPPMKEDGEDGREFEFVWVSAVVAYSGTETYIFGSDENGEVLAWGELGGSFRGELDIHKALRNAGYEVYSLED